MKTFSSLLLLASCAAAMADVRLPAIISDNMVLLSEARANVWGWADAGEKVTVALAGSGVSVVAGPDGRWSVKLEGLKPDLAGDMTVTGKNTLTVKNVAVGEVWLASGQSNMEWTVKASANAEAEIAACQFPEIRTFKVERNASATVLEDVKGKWLVATPENAPSFSAVAYFFSRELHQKKKVPVGFINSTWGGTPVESWMPASGLDANPGFRKHWEKLQAALPERRAAYDKAAAEHKAAAEKAKAEGRPAPRAPRAPDGPEALFAAPSGLYNAMIAPLAGMTVRGAIWYQGESNAGPNNRGNMSLYGQLFPTLILSWRYEFARAQGIAREESEFPFLYVQLANFQKRHAEPTDSYWALIREAQLGTLEVPRTGMAVTIDIGEADDIHPKNKQEVGRRLALAAFAQVYFDEMEYSGPIYSGSQVEEGKIRLNFSNAEGMKSADGGPIKGFAIAGEDQKFHWAEVKIEGDHLVVSSPAVPAPLAVRYAWADNPECNLVNAAGLPASPFRTDTWEQKPPAGAAGN